MKNRRSLRNLVLDRGLQLKLLRHFVLSVLVTAMLLGAFLWHTSVKLLESAEASVQSQLTAAQAARDLAVQKIDARLLMMHGQDSIVPPWEVATAQDKSVVENRFAEERAEADKNHAEILYRHRVMVAWLFVSLLALVSLVAGASLFISHRIAGPAFRMRRLVGRVINGDLTPEPRGLRHRDELQDVFSQLCAMVQALRARELEDIDALREIHVAAERRDSARLVTGVEELLSAKQLRLGVAPLAHAPANSDSASETARTAA